MKIKNMTKVTSDIEDKTREEVAKRLKIERDKDRQMVKGKFTFHEVPNGVVAFCFKKYAQDPLEKYELYDGQVYTIPLGVAKHLNSVNTSYPIHEYAKTEEGQIQRIGKRVRRTSFQSLEFMDMEGLEDNLTKIVTVENVLAV